MALLLIKIAHMFQRKKNPLFSADIGVQQKYMRKLGIPEDNIERGYFQYRCQMRLLGCILAFLYNLTSIPLMFLYKKRIARAQAPNSDDVFDGIFIFAGADTILPLSLKEKYSIKQVKDCQSQQLLIKEDILFLNTLRKRYPFAWHFRFKCLMKIAMYRYQIMAYRPAALIVSSEYSFTSSVLTAYCEGMGIKHINVMHGEKLFYMRDSFFHFHECYVWDEHYRKLFTDLQAEPTQFIIDVPPSLAKRENSNVPKTVDYTYYLGTEKIREMKQIKRSLDLLVKSGGMVAIRPHPLYSSARDIQSVFGADSNYIIEDKSILPIEISLLRTRYAVSCYSTVLFQAINNGVTAVIDDTDKEKYKKLKSLRYICLEKEHMILSDLINKTMNKE